MRPTYVLVALLALPGCLIDDTVYDNVEERLTDDDGDGFTEAAGDCNDADPAIRPDQLDGCDEVDSDCDGTIDEDIDRAWWPDVDRDGFGADIGAVIACEAPAETVLDARDCDDADPTASPAAEELCNARDDDCDGVVDDGLDARLWYRDDDGDGYGATDDTLTACSQPPGYAAEPGDCDEAAAGVHPGAQEVCSDGVDQDCDGTPSGCGWSDEETLATSTRLDGAPADGAGADLVVGDVDGDTIDDVLVGSTAGSVAYLVRGHATRPAGATLDGYARTTIRAVDMGSWFTFGGAVTLCDLDAVGRPDLVVSGQDPSGISVALVWDAASVGPVDEDHAVELAGGIGDMFGTDLACGRVNDDTYDDLVAGAPTSSDDAGAVIVVSGPSRGAGTAGWDTDDAWDPPRATIYGEDPGDLLGSSLVVADLDGDGVEDLLAGSPGDGAGGEAAGAVWALLDVVDGAAPSDLGVKLVAPTANGGAGPVAAGDLDGDGSPEIVVGAPGDGDAGATVGTVYVIGSGTLDPESTPEVDLDDAGAKRFGHLPGLRLGASVAVVGGRYGQGTALALGAPGAYSGAGAVYLWDGTDVLGTSEYADTADAVLLGDAPGDAAGTAIAGTGDLDDDGWIDLLIGAPGHDGAGAGAGTLYLAWGSGL